MKLKADDIRGIFVTTLEYLFSCSIYKNVKIQIYRLYFKMQFIYRLESSFLTLREEHKSRGCENSVLRIFRPKMEDVTGSLRK
jgi:hypothetical protein